MVIVNFYKPHPTSWDELQIKALDIIAENEKQANQSEVGDISAEQQFEDYRTACMSGLKTFIMQVLNEWGIENILFFNDKFYKKFDHIEMEGLLNTFKAPNLFKSTKELFKFFKEEKLSLEPADFDFIHETFLKNEDVICNLLVFEYEFKDVIDDRDWMDDNGFGGILD
jgi:hypothetical protein